MIKKSYIVEMENGVHARPAGMVMGVCSKFKSDIKLSKNDRVADGKSLFSIISLGLTKGDAFSIKIEGDDEVEASLMLTGVLSSGEFKFREILEENDPAVVTGDPKLRV